MPSTQTPHIPAEIIREIFSHLSSPLRVHEAREFPWYLGHVCSEWRAIFHSMQPFFWNEIKMEVPERCTRIFFPFEERTMEILDFFLDMTRGGPFSFDLYKETANKGLTPGDTQSGYVQRILSKLLDYSTQWKNASMGLQLPNFVLLRNAKGRLPLLQSLDFSLWRHQIRESRQDIAVLPQLGDIFKDAPGLARLKLCCLEDVLWKFNWTSLTSISIRSPWGHQSIVSILRQTVNLEELTLSDSCSVEASDNKAVFQLPRLRYLCICKSVALLTIFRAPALEVLKIDFRSPGLYLQNGDELERGMVDKTVKFLLESDCKLSVFFSVFLRSPALQKILSHVPDLKELSMIRYPTPHPLEVARWLAGSDETDHPHELPVPLLNTLSLDMCMMDTSKPKHLQTCLEAVRNLVARRSPPDSAMDSGFRQLILRVPRSGLDGFKSLGSFCRDRGIELEFTDAFRF